MIPPKTSKRYEPSDQVPVPATEPEPMPANSAMDEVSPISVQDTTEAMPAWKEAALGVEPATATGPTAHIEESFRRASETDPDTAAKLLELSNRTGVSPLVIQEDPTLRAMADTPPPEPDKVLKWSPTVAAYLQVPANAAVSRDDVDNLSWVERQIKAVTLGWEMGSAEADLSEGYYRQYFEGDPKAPQDVAHHTERLRALQREAAEAGVLDSWLTSGVRIMPMMTRALVEGADEGIQGAMTGGTAAFIAGQLGPQVAAPEELVTVPSAAIAGYVAGSAYGAANYTRRVEAGAAAQEYISKGVDPNIALPAAAVVGTINGLLELSEMGTLFKTIPGGKALLKRGVRAGVLRAFEKSTVREAVAKLASGYGKTLTAESLQEVAQEAATAIGGEVVKEIQTATGGKELPPEWEKLPARLAQTFVQSMKAFSLSALPGHAVQAAGDLLTKAQAPKLPPAEKVVAVLQEGAQKSKTAARAPDKFEQVVKESLDKAGAPAKMYLRARDVLVAAQDEAIGEGSAQAISDSQRRAGGEKTAPAPIESILDKLGVDAETFREALALDSYLEVPTARVWRLADSPAETQLSEKLTWLPPEPQVDIEALGALAQTPVEPPTEQLQRLRDDLVHIAGFPQEQADKISTVIGERAIRWSLLTGKPPAEYFRKWGFKVQQPEQTVVDRAARAPRPAGTATVPKKAPAVEEAAAQPAKQPAAEADKERATAKAPKMQVPKAEMGAQTKLYTQRHGEVTAHYAVVDASQVKPSHDPRKNFAWTEGYPKKVQERRYDLDKNEQLKVIQNANQLKPLYLLNTNPDATNGPPIVTPDGLVLGGNSRAMSLLLAYEQHPERAAEYKARLEQTADLFGVPADRIKDMKRPVLVRVIDPGTTKERKLHRWATDLNFTPTESMGEEAQAASRGNNVSPATLERIGSLLAEHDTTIRGLLDKPKYAQEIIALLRKDGVISEREGAKYWSNRYRKITKAGKDLVEATLLGSVLQDAELMQVAPRWVLDRVGRNLDQFARIKAAGGEWDITPYVAEAVELVTEMENHGYKKDMLRDFLRQESLPGTTKEWSPKAVAIANAFLEMKPTQLRKAFTGYAQDARLAGGGQTTIMKVDPAEAFNAWFGINAENRVDALFQSAYHGSPHRFDRFSLEHIGTGEGAQDYGWGLYFASQKDIAEYYAQGVGEDEGHLYKVEIPDDETLLDWDKPLSEQSEYVRRALSEDNPLIEEDVDVAEAWDRMQQALQVLADEYDNPDPTGAELYGWIARPPYFDNEEWASRGLNELGVKGIKYRDAASRGFDGEGTYNYVIFDDEAIKILDTFYQGRDIIKGYTRFMRDQTAIFAFTEAKDVSTAIHEIGHVLRRDLEDVVATIDTLPISKDEKDRLRNDWATVLDWVGAEPGKGWTVEQEEKFARGFERYVMEGKAPSNALRRVFETLRAWLVSIYRNLRNLNVELNDDVRGVFDRMLATDDAIRQAKTDARVAPMLEGKPEWMSDDLWNQYRQQFLFANLSVSQSLIDMRMAAVQRNIKEWRAEGLEQARAHPGQVIISEIMEAGGISPNEAALHLSEADLSRLRKKRVGLIRNDAQRSILEELAAKYKTDPKTLLGTIIDTPTLAELTDAYVSRKIREWDASVTPVELAATPEYLELLKEEARLLGVSEEAMEPALDETNLAMTDITDQDIKALANQVASAARAAREAYKAGKKEEAAKAKLRQLKTAQKMREKATARREVARAKNVLNRAARRKPFDPNRGTGVDDAFLQQIRQIADTFLRLPKSFKPRPGTPAFSDFMAELRESGEFDEDLLELMPPLPSAILEPRHWMDLADIVQQLEWMGRKRGKLQYIKSKASIKAAVDDLVGTLQEVKGEPRTPASWREVQDAPIFKRKGRLGGFFAELTKVQFILRRAGGWKDQNPFIELIWRPIKEAEDRKLDLWEKVHGELTAIFDQIPAAERKNWRTANIDLGRKEIPLLTMEEMLFIALNSGNKGNLAALTQNPSPRFAFLRNRHNLRLILNHLDERHWKVVTDIWRMVDRLFPLLDEAHFQATGRHLVKVEGDKVRVRAGEFDGGYFPLIFDPRESDIARMHREAGEDLMSAAAKYGKMSTRAGATHQRKGGKQAPLLSFAALQMHLGAVVHDISHRTAVRDVQKIMTNPQFVETFKAYLGDDLYQQLRTWLRDVARPEPVPVTHLEGILDGIRKNVTLVSLGLKVLTSIKQSFSYTQTVDELGLKWSSRGLRRFLSHPLDGYAFAAARSVQLRNRKKTWDREVSNLLRGEGLVGVLAPRRHNKAQAAKETFSYTRRKTAELFMWSLRMVDMATTTATWLSAYEQAIHDGRTDADAVFYADNVVTATQPASGIKDLVALHRKPGFTRLITMFQTFFISYQNRMQEVYYRLREDPEFGLMDGARSFIYLTVLPVFMSYLLAERSVPDDVDDWKEAGKQLVQYLVGGVPIVRDAVSALTSGFGYSLSPIEGAVEAVVYFKNDLLRALDPDKEVDPQKLTKHVTLLLGYLLGLPARQAVIAMEGVRDLAEGRTSNPLRLLIPPTTEERKER